VTDWPRLFLEGRAEYPPSAYYERMRRNEQAFIEELIETFDAVEVETLVEGGTGGRGESGSSAWSEAPGREATGPSSGSLPSSTSVPTGHGSFQIPGRVQGELALRGQQATKREGP
jgi:hypothetical protein